MDDLKIIKIDDMTELDDRDVIGSEMEIITDLSLLNKPCAPCHFDFLGIKNTQEIAANVIATIQATSNCLSLSANQLGYDRQIFVYFKRYNSGTDQNEFEVIINPKLVPLKTYGMRQYRESCHSYPDTLKDQQSMHLIRRYKRVKLFYKDVYGNDMQRTYIGKDAVIIQHEIDHIKGIVR